MLVLETGGADIFPGLRNDPVKIHHFVEVAFDTAHILSLFALMTPVVTLMA